jgi:hypothetical protein
VNKLSLISKSVAEIQINNQPCRGINLTNTTYTRPRIGHVWQPFTTILYGRFGSHLYLVHVFHVIPHYRLSVGGSYTIPLNISRGMVEYRLTVIIIELRQFTGPHKSSMWSVHNQMLAQGSSMNGPQSTQAGLPPWSPKYPHTTPRPSHLKMLCFPLVAPLGLKFKSSFHSLSNFNHFNSIRGKKGPTCE